MKDIAKFCGNTSAEVSFLVKLQAVVENWLMFSPEFSDFYQNTFFVENLCVAGIDLPFLIELKTSPLT